MIRWSPIQFAVFVIADPIYCRQSIARSLQVGASLWYLVLGSFLAACSWNAGLKGGWWLMFAFLIVGVIPCLMVIGRIVVPAETGEWRRDASPSLDAMAGPLDVSQPVVFRPTIGRRLLLLLICLVFLASGLWMAQEGQALGWLLTGFFGLGATVITLQSLPNCSYLRVSASGLDIRSLWRTQRYEWTDISHFYAGRIGKHKMVLIGFNPSYQKTYGSLENQ